MAELPDRVLVYGVTGSGKSTAALAIGARTGHPVTLVDELTWLPGWVPVDGEAQRELVSEVVAGERWLLDSAYGAWLDLVLPRAELVVGLDYPRWLSLGRQARIRVRLRAKDWKCHPMIESRATTLRQVSTLPLQRGSFVIAAETVLRTSRPRESQRG